MTTLLGSDTTRIILLIAWIVILLVIVSIPASAVYLLLTTGAAPKPLDDWAMLCLGFIFGALFSLLKERT